MDKIILNVKHTEKDVSLGYATKDLKKQIKNYVSLCIYRENLINFIARKSENHPFIKELNIFVKSDYFECIQNDLKEFDLWGLMQYAKNNIIMNYWDKFQEDMNFKYL